MTPLFIWLAKYSNVFCCCHCSDSLDMATTDSKSTAKMKEINSHELLQLQCKIASDRIHLVDIETNLADTSTLLTNERAKNKSLVKIVYYLENVIEKKKDHYNDRASNITNMLQLQAKNNLKKTLAEKLKKVTATHFQAMENLRQEHRHQIKISNEVISPFSIHLSFSNFESNSTNKMTKKTFRIKDLSEA